MPKIDFKVIADAALRSAWTLLPRAYPNGVIVGDEFCVGDIDGAKGQSLKFNLKTGKWKDFNQPEHSGGDMISLFAARDGVSQLEAAQHLAHELGLDLAAGPVRERPTREPLGEAVAPVPADVARPRLEVGAPHPVPRMAGHLMANWWQYLDGQRRLLFFSVRYDKPGKLTAKGKTAKVFWPYSYFGEKGWRLKGWGRLHNPLYGLDRLAERPDAAVLLVEGEKAADAAERLFPEHVVVSWFGGLGQLSKADFGPLAGRAVVYCPDADLEGRNSVTLVAAKLAAAGAASLRVVDPPASLPDGWDLADEAPLGVNFAELIGTAEPYSLSEQWLLLQDLDLQQLLLRFVFNVGTEQFIDRETGLRLSRPQMDALYRHTQPSTSIALLSNGQLVKVQRLSFRPGNSDRIVKEKNGRRSLNLWTPSDVMRIVGDASIIERHLQYLCPRPREYDHLVDMLAFMVQRPGEKLKSAIVLAGAPGTGKSFVGRFMRAIIGDHNTSVVSTSHVKSQFNDYLEAKQLVIVEEIMTVGRLDIMNMLKPYITEPCIRVDVKHQRPYEIENLANFIFFTNHEDALRIKNDERRYFIAWSDDPPQSREYYVELFAWEKQNRGVILDWLLSRDLSNFDPDAPPPVTEGKLRMIRASRDEIEAWLEELIENRQTPFERDLVELSEVYRVLSDAASSTRWGVRLSRPILIRALKDLGATDLGQRRGIVGGLTQRKSLWAVRDVEGYLGMSARALIEHYTSGKAASDETDGSDIPL